MRLLRQCYRIVVTPALRPAWGAARQCVCLINGPMKFTVARRNFWQQTVFSIVLALFATSAGAQTLIPFGATWKYLDNGSDQGTAWKDSGFIDSGWLSGPGVLGFDTTVPIATTNSAGNITYYYRT